MTPRLAKPSLLTLTAPTALAIGVAPVPPLRLSGEDLPALLQARLRAAEPVFAAVYGVRPWVAGVAGVLAAVVIGAALAAALSGRMRRPVLWRYPLLGVLAIPSASWLGLLLARRPTSSAEVVGGVLAAWVLAWGAASALAWAGGPRRALAALLLGTAAVVLLDQWFGGALAIGVLGYSPLDGARFYGLGNEGAAVLFAAALVGGTVALEAYPLGPRRRILAAWAIPLLGAVVVLTSAAPSLGANFTVALWGTVGFAVAAIGASERRFGWREAGIALAGLVVLLAAIAAIDLAGAGAGTHLSRAIRGLARDGGAGAIGMLAAKSAMNLRILLTVPGGMLVPVATAGFAYLLWRPPRRLAPVLAARPAFASGLRGATAGAVLGLVTEDTGVLIAAIVLVFAAGALAYVAALPKAASSRASAPVGPLPAEEVGE